MAYFKTASPDRYNLLHEYALQNRKNATLAEDILWQHLRKNDFGVKFLRQHVIGDYIVDFLAKEQGLVIEVDGAYHAERQQQENDVRRTADLEEMGFHVIRFTNEEVEYNIEEVMILIKNNFQ